MSGFSASHSSRLIQYFCFLCRVAEFVDALDEVINIEKNGSVWLIEGGKAKEIKCKNHWFDSE